MRYSYIAAPLALAAGASASHLGGNSTIEYTTEVVTAFTTYCPSATSIVHASSTYVVTEVSHLRVSKQQNRNRTSHWRKENVLAS